MRPLARMLGLALLGSVGCGAFGEPEQTDGDVCERDDDCESGYCTLASVCSHARCDCPSGSCAPSGEETDDCRDGWVCIGHESIFEPVVDFFGGQPNDSDGYCMPRCADGLCPEHYLCSGELCTPDAFWAYPVPAIAWSGAASGEADGRGSSMSVTVEEGSTLSLTGSATSPMGTEITTLAWTTNSQSGEHASFEGPTIVITVPTGAGSFRRAELTATDARGRTGLLDVVFQACFGTGTTCGYEGSGCCTSCDDATDTCH
jgi:hypothetical protein